MKKKIFSILLSLALMVTMMPAQTLVVSAATKTKATVSTQTGLKQALKNKKLKTLTVKTGETKTFNINKGTHKKVHMIIDASRSTVKNKSIFKKITIKRNKTLVMNASKGNIAVSKGGKANEVKLTKGNSKIDFKVNGQLKKISVEKKSDVNIKGSTKKPINVKAGENSDETVINTSIKVNAKIESNSKIVLVDGSEGSSIAVTNKDVLVTVVNNTDESYTAIDAYGSKVEIKKDAEVVIGGSTSSPIPTDDGKTFKAVYNSSDALNTLTFYYDDVDHSGDNITVYEDGTDNLLFDDSKQYYLKWGYNGIRNNIKKVVIDESVQNYKGLTSTVSMFQNMRNAESFVGAEYLNVTNVTDMQYMFSFYGYNLETLNTVPNVSNWNTSKVTNMYGLFDNYGYKSTLLNTVPNVSNWNTSKVTNMDGLFGHYGYSSTELNAVPDVSSWNTAEVTDLRNMFISYAYSSLTLNCAPNTGNWNTAEVTNMQDLFYGYGHESTVLNTVPNVSNWNTGQVTSMLRLFEGYGYTSEALNCVPNVSSWNTAKVTTIANMFQMYGYSSTALTSVPNVSSWNTELVSAMNNLFNSFGYNSEVLNFNLDLSNWSVGSATQYGGMFYNSGYKTTTWTVTIPARTGDRDNSSTAWYVGDGTDETKYIETEGAHTFTL